MTGILRAFPGFGVEGLSPESAQECRWMRQNSYGGRPGRNCSWEAIAALIYGSKTHWQWVKTEHMAFVERVMGDSNHLRYIAYSRLLRTLATSITTTATGPTNPAISNIRRLLFPGYWTSIEMCPITCDRYKIQLVIFVQTIDKTGLTSREIFSEGSNNAAQRVLWKTNNHFEPIFPHFQGNDNPEGHNWAVGELRIELPKLRTDTHRAPGDPNQPNTRPLQRKIWSSKAAGQGANQGPTTAGTSCRVLSYIV
ncbi:hypothetical protein P152DRAFT_110612 [Eremomyces bilateralis CBS 781.70]|uniref:Uncharacterized protein n=1 Tax=Eremomyces bilateralis CBS 781.70 TaxID=1392243 RepID=A0A6G1GDC0_9PEZI|nr:uncharacterized protein P152DRAFT_110612 [Eremomyces bilateralis CBS 781.70]KAF1816097.1 hypothetical protein P152DRAFT_110612 [Eremomyces bilateralis CBS 781.70]